MASMSNIPFTSQLKVTGGNVAAEWKRFKSQWTNFEVASDLDEKPSSKRAAIFLACIGTEAYETFQTMDFESEGDRSDIEKVIEAFERHCVGEVNITFERYVFNRRTQDVGETFDAYMSDLRRLIKSCDYGALEESILRDRIVIGIRDDATRRKLLQMRKLTLNSAIDVCKASEVAAKQLREMSTPDEVNAMQHASRESPTRMRINRRYPADADRHRGWNSNSRCQFCGRDHEPSREACPAFGQTCRRCLKRNHFEMVCKAELRETNGRICQLQDESLLTLTTSTEAKPEAKRIYSQLMVEGYEVGFLIDGGSTVNLLSSAVLQAIDAKGMRTRNPNCTLRMFENVELKTAGMITARVQHPRTLREVKLDFYITETHQQPVLGLEACLLLELVTIVHEKICESKPALELSPTANGLRHESRKMEAIRQVPPLAAVKKVAELLPTPPQSQNSYLKGLTLAEAEIDTVPLQDGRPVDCESRAMNTSRSVTPVEQDGKAVEQDSHSHAQIVDVNICTTQTNPDATNSDVRRFELSEGSIVRRISVNESDQYLYAQSQRDMSSLSLYLDRRSLMNDARDIPDDGRVYVGRHDINRVSDHSPSKFTEFDYQCTLSIEVDNALRRQAKTGDDWGAIIHTFNSCCETAFD